MDSPGWSRKDPDGPKLLCFPFWQSYFIKLFDADLQCEFIRTFLYWSKNVNFSSRYFRYVFESSSVSIKNENWAQSPTVQPDNLSKFEHCVHIYGTDGFWYDELCNIKKYFVCEDMNNDILFWRTCPLTWDLINKKCYHKASSNTVSHILTQKGAI